MQLKSPVIGIKVYLERRKARILVGSLTKESDHFVFIYDDKYLRAPRIIPLGPEFPLTKRRFESIDLFPSLQDRIPSKENSAYPDYCRAMGIAETESNVIVLLATIGSRGPSSFVFEPIYDRSFTADDIVRFRQTLGFTMREFAKVFELGQGSLNSIEKKKMSGKDTLKRLEIISRFPEVARFYLQVNGGAINTEKRRQALKALDIYSSQTS